MTHPAHLDYDVLADLAEGLLDEARAASVNEHLDSCAPCRDLSADLADVSRLLAEAPAPSLPPDLAARIDSALAAESRGDAPVVSLAERRGRRPWRILSAAAAAVVVLGGGGLVAQTVLEGGDDTSSTTAQQPLADPTRPSDAPLAVQVWRPTSSGTAYRAATLAGQVRDRLAQAATSAQAPPADERLTGCVNRVTGGRPPALVDRATLDGGAALIIAVRAQSRLDVWAVDPACSADDPKILQHTG
ncbi:anti-sigma factor family protein [Actinomadura flavalba]|uniref:anti-sigma factor family protein n=1 Tax=Actinomadura flavalba TaxID=1120938 RepID=UPI00037FC967|nr:zf-HC2 domain-containing protein [Actinomadura flavalba]